MAVTLLKTLQILVCVVYLQIINLYLLTTLMVLSWRLSPYSHRQSRVTVLNACSWHPHHPHSLATHSSALDHALHQLCQRSF